VREERYLSDRIGIIVTVTVGMPAASITRANTGTFLQQSGQAGARISASISAV
jgi:hypothetical protein